MFFIEVTPLKIEMGNPFQIRRNNFVGV